MHQVLLCEATAVVRHQHPAAVAKLEEEPPIHLYLPMLFQDLHASFVRNIQQAMPCPDLALTQPHYDCFFTDGSCQNPADPKHRISGYAVVSPRVSLTELSVLESTDFLSLEPYFEVLAVALQQGAQTVDRSELQAVVATHELQLEAPVYTDSQYVVDTHQLLQRTVNLKYLHKKPHLDLLKRWHFLIWDLGVLTPTVKVKAHQSLTDCTGQNRAERLGNHFADLVAKQAVKELHQDYTMLLSTMQQAAKRDHQEYDAHLKLRADLSQFRKQLEVVKPPPQLSKTQRFAHILRNWDCRQYTYYQLQDQELQHIVYASKWGVKFSELVLRWTQLLAWPAGDPSDPADPGITWIELAINFWLCAQQSILIPVQRGTVTEYVDYTTISGWLPEQCQFSDFVHQFQQCIQHLESLTTQSIVPPRTRQLIGTLYQLGAGVFKRGFCTRPKLPLTETTISILVQYIADNNVQGKLHLAPLPTNPLREPCVVSRLLPLLEDTPAMSHQRFSARRSLIRAQRNQSALEVG